MRTSGHWRIAAAAVVALALALGAESVQAQSFTIQQIINNGNSVTFGDKVFSDWSVTVNASAGSAVTPNAGTITVNYLGLTGTTETLGFDFNAFAGAFTPGSFSDADFTIRFHVHSLGTPIQQIGLGGVAASTSGTSTATIDETSSPAGTPTDIHYQNVDGIVTQTGGTIAYAPPVTDLSITKNINVSAFNGGGPTAYSTMSAFDETFTQTPVPEPASLIMAGLACTGLVARGFRKRHKARFAGLQGC
jgi:hypothetical protein